MVWGCGCKPTGKGLCVVIQRRLSRLPTPLHWGSTKQACQNPKATIIYSLLCAFIQCGWCYQPFPSLALHWLNCVSCLMCPRVFQRVRR